MLDEDPGLGQANYGVAGKSDIWVWGAELWGTWLNKIHGILRGCGMLNFLGSGWKTWSFIDRALVLFGVLGCYRGMCAIPVALALVPVHL